MNAARRRWTGRALLALSLSGCATQAGPVDDADAAPDQGGLVGQTGAEPDAEVLRLPDMGPNRGADFGAAPLPDAAPPAGCQPGERLGLCEVCGPMGTPDAPADDPECPPVDCATLEVYRRADEGEARVCVREVYEGRVTGCIARGRCAMMPDPVVCGASATLEVERVDDVCATLAGCNGATPPEVMPAPDGAECPDGLCVGGACDRAVFDECAAFLDAAAALCGAGVHRDGTRHCELDVVGEDESCRAWCARFGARCLLAWLNPEGGCVPQQEAGCLDAAPRLLCRCSQP